MFGSPEKIKSEELIEFYCELSDAKSDIYNITRIFNAINKLILLIRGIKKMVIHADSGEILSLFLTSALPVITGLSETGPYFNSPHWTWG